MSQVLETLCTLISDSEDSKSSCALVQENRQSILSFVIEYLSRPSTASDHNFRLALKMLGSLCICKETRQLLIKSKYPQGLGQRLVKIWNECKDPQAIPVKSPFMLEFLATFAFFEEGQKAIAAIPGLIDVLVEVLDRYTRSAMKYEAVEASLLLLRNLCFSVSNKPHVLANSQAFPLLLAYVSSSSQKPKLRSLASSALWALLYHHQKVKAIFKQENILRELENVQREAQKDAEKMSEKGADLEKLKETAENLNSVLKICIDP